MSVTAKSVILDISDDWGGSEPYMALRSVEFALDGVVIPMTAGFTAYATTLYTGYYAEMAFDTSLSKVGSWSGNSWISTAKLNQRLIVVFDSPLEFDTIIINNGHLSGGYTLNGVRNVKITISTDAITDTTYNSAISNSELLFDGEIRSHTLYDTVDPITAWTSVPVSEYTSHFPPEFTSDYVRATSSYSGTLPEDCCNPSKSLVGTQPGNGWVCNSTSGLQKLNIDHGAEFILSRVYIENSHWTGTYTNQGAKNIEIYGTNSATAFANLVYTDLTDLTLLGTFVVAQHVAVNAPDPQYLTIVGNETAYRYTVVRVIDSWGGGNPGLRRIEFQALDEDVPVIQYKSEYPPEHSDTYVKTTSEYSSTYAAYFVTDPSKSLVGLDSNNGWVSADVAVPLKINIDHGEAILPARIYLENYHSQGNLTNYGIKSFEVYGTNSATAFAQIDATDLTDLTLLGTFAAEQHIAADTVDPQYFLITGNDTPYRYTVIRFTDRWDGLTRLGLRRIEIQVVDAVAAALRSVLVQSYNLLSDMVRQIVTQEYAMTDAVRALLIQQYGLKMLVLLEQLYGNARRFLGLFTQCYEDCNVVRRSNVQNYGNAASYRQQFEQGWDMPEGLRRVFEQRYSISESGYRAMLDHVYDVSDVELLRAQLDQLYVLAAGEALVQRTDQAVYCGGAEHTSAYNIMIEQDESLFYMVGELQLADEVEFLQYRPFETDVVIEVDDRQYLFIVDADPRRSRQPGENVFVVPLVSKTVLLDSPHSVIASENLSGMAADLVAVLAAPFVVDWQLVNWFIPPNILQGNGESAISVIKRIVAAAGGIVQTSPAGVLVCRPEYPVSVNEWFSAAPALELTDQDDFFSIDPSPDPRPGYNVFFLTNQSLASDGVSLDIVHLSATENELRVSMLPWSDTARAIMHHSGGSWVQVIDQGIVIETIEEQVEIIAGAGQTTKPVFAYVDHKYSVVDLGVIEVAEAGNVTTELADNSLLQLTYQTRYWSFLAIDKNIEDVQFFPEIIES